MYLLLGLLALDLLGFFPGVNFLTSAVAAVILLSIDARGLVTLNGVVKWRRMSFGQKLLAGLLEIVLFQFLVAANLVQRLFEAAKASVVPSAGARSGARGWDNDRAPELAERPGAAHMQSTDAADGEALQSALDAQLAQVKHRLPSELLEKVRTLASSISEVLPAYQAAVLEPQDRFVVERTVNDYLPSALQAYLKIPATYRTVPLPDADGKTASEVLSDQLDLLINRIQLVVDSSYRDDLQALLVHGRFLQSKFGRSRLAVRA